MSKQISVSALALLVALPVALLVAPLGCDTETTDTQPRAAQLEPRFDPGVQVDAPAVEPVFGSLDERLAALQPVKTRAGWLRYVDPAIEAPAAAPILLARLSAGQDEPEIRVALAEAIGRTGGDYVAGVTAQLAVESDARVREMLVGTLGRRATSGDVRPGLMAGLHDASPQVRAAAVWAIGERGDAAGFGAELIHTLDDDDVLVRRAAARTLGVIGDAAAVASLTELLDDADADVRLHALRAIHRIDPQVAASLGRLDVLAQDDDRRVRGLVGKIRG